MARTLRLGLKPGESEVRPGESEVRPGESEAIVLTNEMSYHRPPNGLDHGLHEWHGSGTSVKSVIPAENPGDAMQLTIAAGHQVDYLLTWNYAHLANPVTQAKAEHLLTRRNLRAPLVVSPESIPQVWLGQ